MNRARLIAFHLPQFHRFPQNDEWWGKGFTEWTNVTRAKPLFPGHFQPRLPADLGFYDLRVPETRAEQGALARAYSIEGFCYWHYWFHGKRLMERVEQDIVNSGIPDFPFCLAWANHNWSRTWLGDTQTLLMGQTYSMEDDYAHARYLAPIFADPRYVRVTGRPVFAIFMPLELPDPRKTTDILRGECVRLGLPEPYLLGYNHHQKGVDFREFGFDMTLDAQPDFHALPRFTGDWGKKTRIKSFVTGRGLEKPLNRHDYLEASQRMLGARPKDHPFIPNVIVGFDNSARRGDGALILHNASPQAFETCLNRVLTEVDHRPYEERLVFINAWNEWAEAMYLEPDQRYGHGFLEAVRTVNQAQITNVVRANPGENFGDFLAHDVMQENKT